MRRQAFRDLFWICLLPLSVLWAGITLLRRRTYLSSRRYRAGCPVWCVGNIHSGGSGKTPLVMEICRRFAERNPAVLSRGYHGSLSERGARVDPHDPGGPAAYGDEPWMMANRLPVPVYVGRRRAECMPRIQADHRGLIVLDDGFQHFGVWRDLDIVVINTDYRLSDSFCLPLGDLREPLSALAHASAIVLNTAGNEESADEWRSCLAARFPNVPRFVAKSVTTGLWDGEKRYSPAVTDRVTAFCGIADPDRFRRDVAALVNLAAIDVFPDHHAYSEADIDRLFAEKQTCGADYFVTTDKDWFKALPFFTARGARLLSLRIRYDIPDEFWYFLGTRLEPK